MQGVFSWSSQFKPRMHDIGEGDPEQTEHALPIEKLKMHSHALFWRAASVGMPLRAGSCEGIAEHRKSVGFFASDCQADYYRMAATSVMSSFAT